MTGIAWIAQATMPTTAPATRVADLAEGSGMGFWLIVLAVMALLPFLLTMVTSFAKLVIVGGILRQALGTQNIPPTTVITGLALILTAHIMAPVAQDAYQRYRVQQAGRPAESRGPLEVLKDVAAAAEPPLREFLTRHSTESNRELFRELAGRLREANTMVPATTQAAATQAAATQPATQPATTVAVEPLDPVARGVEDLTILAPAFILTELTKAFLIGFIIFVPFLIIDLVVSNVLLAMGMHMLSPVTVSLPLKLLLFVAIDGWRLLLQGLALSYT